MSRSTEQHVTLTRPDGESATFGPMPQWNVAIVAAVAWLTGHESTVTPVDAEPDIDALAVLIAPRIVAEYGPHPRREDVSREIEDIDKHPELSGLNSGELELLYDEIRDIVPTLTVTAA